MKVKQDSKNTYCWFKVSIGTSNGSVIGAKKTCRKKVLRDSTDSKKPKQSSENDIQGDEQMRSTEEEAWKNFIVDEVNDTEQLDNVVGV